MLVQVTRYTESGYETMAEAVYDGDGRRRELTVWALGVSETLTFSVDVPTGQVLRSESASGEATTYLYGLGLIGEQEDEWFYHLPDRERSVRQIVDESGTVTLARLYTPLGALLKERGNGWSAYGFLGAVAGAAPDTWMVAAVQTLARYNRLEQRNIFAICASANSRPR